MGAFGGGIDRGCLTADQTFGHDLALSKVVGMSLLVRVVVDVADLLGVVQLNPALLHVVHDHVLHVLLRRELLTLHVLRWVEVATHAEMAVEVALAEASCECLVVSHVHNVLNEIKSVFEFKECRVDLL